MRAPRSIVSRLTSAVPASGTVLPKSLALRHDVLQALDVSVAQLLPRVVPGNACRRV